MLSVRPPEYFPGLEFVALMMSVEDFVMADMFQYSRQSFQNRTRVRSSQGAHWLTVPLSGGQHGYPSVRTRISPIVDWRQRHWKALVHSYGRTPFFARYEAALADFFATEHAFLADATCASVTLTHALFGLRTRLWRASVMEGQPCTMAEAARSFPHQVVLLPPAAAHADRHREMKIRMLDFMHPTYRQAFAGFVSGMTALDLLFNYGPDSAALLERAIAGS